MATLFATLHIMATFPDKLIFPKDTWRGSRAQTYLKAEDAFQQLVGDWLSNLYGSSVSVAPTLGRDGAVDMFIPALATQSCNVLELNGSTIVECKSHDVTLSTLDKNIISTAEELTKKIKKASENGFCGLYAPWLQATHYIYAVSANLTAAVKLKLETELSELKNVEGLNLQKITVLDWGSLSRLFNNDKTLCDQWLGVDISSLQAHDDLTRQNEAHKGFKKYLSPANLPFLAPNHGHPAHPDIIWKALSSDRNVDPDKIGYLITGIGGTGKTRSTYEVAQNAANEGWRVLHVKPHDSSFNVSALNSVLEHGQKILLVMDYVNLPQQFEWLDFLNNTLPLASSKQVTLRIIANARPSALVERDATRDKLFTTIALDVSIERQEALRNHIVSVVAPTAFKTLGKERMAELCGSRPIIATLIALQIERLPAEHWDTLEAKTSADLTHWLKLRLGEDDLLRLPESKNSWTAATVDSDLLVIASMMALCPCTENDLINAAAVCSPTSTESETKSKITFLLRYGWLGRYEYDIHTVHDVATDEICSNVLKNEEAISEPALAIWVKSAGIRPRALGRYLTCVVRLLDHSGWEVLGKDFLNKFAKAIGDIDQKGILEKHDRDAHDEDEMAFALGAVLDPKVIDVMWPALADSMILPWIAKHRTSEAARHIYYRVLHNESTASSLIPAALEWLGIHGLTLDAGFVLAPLIERAQSDTDINSAVTYGSDWLHKHGLRLEARFVLAPLIKRAQSVADINRAVTYGLAWLHKHGSTPGAQFVLARLIKRAESDEDTNDAVTYGLAWLHKYGSTLEADFVLVPLIERAQSVADINRAVTYGLAWLHKHGSTLGANFVLVQLIERAQSVADINRAVIYGLAWLDAHGLTLKADFVLGPLIERAQSVTCIEETISKALRWLNLHFDNTDTDADFVINSLMKQFSLQGEQKRTVLNYALTFCTRNIHDDKATFILKNLLKDYNLDEEINKRRNILAILWLDSHRDSKNCDWVLNRLLRFPESEISKSDRAPLLEYAFEWLNKNKNNGQMIATLTFNMALLNQKKQFELALSIQNFKNLATTESDLLSLNKIVGGLKVFARSRPEDDAQLARIFRLTLPGDYINFIFKTPTL
jgi:hypothetical protein